jgi:hypothetical protein
MHLGKRMPPADGRGAAASARAASGDGDANPDFSAASGRNARFGRDLDACSLLATI